MIIYDINESTIFNENNIFEEIKFISGLGEDIDYAELYTNSDIEYV
jgi:hypothetical protein